MLTFRRLVSIALLVLVIPRAQALQWQDPSPHAVIQVRVARGVDIEVLDWGGQGRPLVLIAGIGGTAHIFDDFALNLVSGYRVYGVTRRGYGASSVPQAGYGADRLGDDVVAVIRSLKLQKPVLVGHSFGGQEVSDVATRFPDLVAGVIYLDAVYSYDAADDGKALYWNVEWKRQIKDLQKHLTELLDEPSNPKSVALELRDSDLPRVTKIAETLIRVETGRPSWWSDPTSADLASFAAVREWYHRNLKVYLPEAEFRQTLIATSDGRPTMQERSLDRVGKAVEAGRKAFHHITVPALYIGAADNDPGDYDRNDPEARANAEAFIAYQNGWIERRTARFLQDAPSGRLVIEQRASHFVFISNQDDVLREMRAFIQTLPP
jgi:non-heme chloroperoxidase